MVPKQKLCLSLPLARDRSLVSSATEPSARTVRILLTPAESLLNFSLFCCFSEFSVLGVPQRKQANWLLEAVPQSRAVATPAAGSQAVPPLLIFVLIFFPPWLLNKMFLVLSTDLLPLVRPKHSQHSPVEHTVTLVHPFSSCLGAVFSRTW